MIEKKIKPSNFVIAVLVGVLLLVSSFFVVSHFYERLVSPEYGSRETITYYFRLDGWGGYGANMTYLGVHPEWIYWPGRFLPFVSVEEDTYAERRKLIEISGSFVIGSENVSTIFITVECEDKTIMWRNFYARTPTDVEDKTWFFYQREAKFQRNLDSMIPSDTSIKVVIDNEENLSVCLHSDSYVLMRWLRGAESPLSANILIFSIGIGIVPVVIAKFYYYVKISPAEEMLKIVRETRERLERLENMLPPEEIVRQPPTNRKSHRQRHKLKTSENHRKNKQA